MLRNYQKIYLIIAVFITGIASKWNLIETYGSDVPYQDPWGAEALVTIIPWLEGELDYWKNFWQPHNEHRIGLTRMWSLLLASISGQWDNQFVCTANALVHCLAVTLTIFIFRRYLVGPGVWIIPIVGSLTLSSNLSWENTLGCFQISFYLSQLLSILFIYFASKTNSLKYLIYTFLIGISSFATMASNVFPIVSIILSTLLLSLQKQNRIYLKTRLFVFLFLLIVSLNLYNEVPQHEILKAHSLNELIISTVNILSLFYFDNLFLSILLLICINSPLVVYSYHIIIKKISIKRNENFILFTFCINILISVLSIAYSRNQISESSRYFDTYFMIFIANSLCIVCLWIKYKKKFNFILNFSVLTWLFIISIILLRNDNQTLLAMEKKWSNIEEDLRKYSFYNDDKILYDSELPYIEKNTITTVMNHSLMQNYLPTSIRKPIKYSKKISYNEFENKNNFSTDNINHYLIKDDRISNSEIIYSNKLKSFIRIYFQGSDTLLSSSISLISKNGHKVFLGDKNLKSTGWQTGHFKISDEFGYFNININPNKKDSWIAFSDLYEVSFCSWFTRQIRKSSTFLNHIGLIFGFIVIGKKLSKDYCNNIKNIN